MAGSSAGTVGNNMQTLGSVASGGNIPAPANVTVTCAPSAKNWVEPGKYVVNDMTKMEAISQPLYSYVSYPAAGTSVLNFFQLLQGSPGTNAEQTNMQAQGALPAPQKFLVQGIGIDYLPGTSPVQGPRADSAQSQANDLWAILRRGVFTLQIGTKNYLQLGPLMQLPVRAHINGALAASTNLTTGAATQTLATYAFSDGDVFKPIPLLLEASQNFICQIAFPGGAVAIPSADNAALIGVQLYGTQYRPPQ